MNIPTSLRLPLAALILGGGIVLLASFAGSREAYRDDDPSYNQAYWQVQLAQEDARTAYASFLKRNANAPFERQHLSAHVMGELIYGRYGIDGIAVCDPSFSYGCYHGFFGRAISEGGEAQVAALDAACINAFGPLGAGCQHGIGHGVLEYVGYNRVNDALKLCEETTYMAPLLGCASGVFMEYNSPLVGVGDTLAPSSRLVSEETLYEPCDEVPQAYRPACYYQLGEWVAPQPSNNASSVRDICAALTGTAREHCFLGAGAGIAPVLSYSVEEARAWCTFEQKEDERACRAGVSWAMYASLEHRGKADAACAYEDAGDEKTCLILADLTQGKAAR